MPVGPSTCRRCLRSTPLSLSAARNMSAFASQPTCALALTSVKPSESTAPLRACMRGRYMSRVQPYLPNELRRVPKHASCRSLICALETGDAVR